MKAADVMVIGYGSHKDLVKTHECFDCYYFLKRLFPILVLPLRSQFPLFTVNW